MGALSHMIKGSLGSGILAMPMAFKNAGLGVGVIGAFLIGYLCTHCVHLLVSDSVNSRPSVCTPVAVVDLAKLIL